MAARGKKPVFTMSLIVTGNLLGAGILALPVNLGPTGLIPSLAAVCIMWVAMTFTAFIYADQKAFAQNPNADLPTFFGNEMGNVVKWIVIVANMIILYGVLVAYLTGVTSIITNLFDARSASKLVLLGYFVIAAGLTGFGMAIMRKYNAFMLITMWITFAIVVAMTLPHMKADRFLPMEWGYWPATLPLLVTAFHFHNIIPTVCRELDFDRKAARKAILIGTTIGFVMNSIWIIVVESSLPMSGHGGHSIMDALAKNQPATVPLSQIIGGRFFINTGLVFALVSMTAAFMANGTALQSFIRDLTSTYLKTDRKAVVWPLAFVPPLAVAMIWPNVFLIALNIVGGTGENILFGILPGVLLWKYSRPASVTRWLGYLLIAFFGVILIFELGQEFGLTHLRPNTEYWSHHNNF